MKRKHKFYFLLILIICFYSVLRTSVGGCFSCYLISRGHSKLAYLFCLIGADVKKGCKNEMTPICCALDAQLPDTSLIELYIERGALEHLDSNPMFCIGHSVTAEKYIDVLLKNKVDANKGGGDGYMPLMYFSESGLLSVVVKLLNAGADINAVTSTGKTALSEAAIRGNVEVVKYLLKAGANRKVVVGGKNITLIVGEKIKEMEEVKNALMLQRYKEIRGFLSL